MTIAPFWLIVLAAACIAAAATDVRMRKIPNLLCLATAIGGLIFAGFAGGIGGLASHAAHGAIALVVGVALFAARVVGGGDAKFYTAITMWFPLAEGLRLLVAVAMAGGVAVLLWMIARRLLRRPWRNQSGDHFAQFPYGIAIGLGTMAAVL